MSEDSGEDDEPEGPSPDDPFLDRTTFRGGEPTDTSRRVYDLVYGPVE